MKIKKYLEKIRNKTISNDEAGATLFFVGRLRAAAKNNAPLNING